ncbi:MAG: K(+)-transporting ATPase subunit C [Chthoniobacteraceae bacterium]|jgi:K+-transporting ATPase ATPase C chain
MKNIITDIRSTIVVTVLGVIVLCGIYPVAVWAIGQTVFRYQANGSLIVGKDGAVYGSAIIGQAFSDNQYFNSRPSDAGTGYDASNSGATNLGPTSQKLHDSIQAAVAAYRTQNGLAANALVPADAVTNSGSGLDPDISVKNAMLQAPRVAKTRKMSLDAVNALVDKYTEGRDFGVFGEPRVNVLKLNLALDGKI